MDKAQFEAFFINIYSYHGKVLRKLARRKLREFRHLVKERLNEVEDMDTVRFKSCWLYQKIIQEIKNARNSNAKEDFDPNQKIKQIEREVEMMVREEEESRLRKVRSRRLS